MSDTVTISKAEYDSLIHLREASLGLVHIVEGIRNREWRDIAPQNGIVRLKDTEEWCLFYVAHSHVKYP